MLYFSKNMATFKMIRKRTQSDQNLSYVDLWNGKQFVKDLPLFPSPTRDMKGQILKANTFDFPPHTYKTAEGYGGLTHKIISAIADNLHFNLDRDCRPASRRSPLNDMWERT